MRHFPAVIVFCVTLLAGCRTPPNEVTAELPIRCQDESPAEERVQVYLAIVERPLGDPTLNRELWEVSDEQILLDQKSLLQANGFRVGLIGGQPPASLQAMLQSPHDCTTLRQVNGAAGEAVPINLGATQPHCPCTLAQGGQLQKVDLENAQAVLEVVVTPADDGKVRLHCTPRIQHGQAALRPLAAKDPAGPMRWAWESRQPEEIYSWLSWEATVAPDDYLIIGTPLASAWQDAGLLGQRFFVQEEKHRRTQRVLVLRAVYLLPQGPANESIARSPPLAARAGLPSARGSEP
jgi:hypothetical protein